MKISLNTKERLATLSILPQQGNLATLKQVREATEALSFSADEQKDLNLVTDANGLTKWDQSKDTEKAIEFSATVFAMVFSELQKLDNNGKLQMLHLSAYEKFASQ